MTHKEIRFRILKSIYKEMNKNPNGYGLSIEELDKEVNGDYRFDLKYLIAKGWVVNSFGYLRLSHEGIDEFEKIEGGLV